MRRIFFAKYQLIKNRGNMYAFINAYILCIDTYIFMLFRKLSFVKDSKRFTYKNVFLVIMKFHLISYWEGKSLFPRSILDFFKHKLKGPKTAKKVEFARKIYIISLNLKDLVRYCYINLFVFKCIIYERAIFSGHLKTNCTMELL